MRLSRFLTKDRKKKKEFLESISFSSIKEREKYKRMIDSSPFSNMNIDEFKRAVLQDIKRFENNNSQVDRLIVDTNSEVRMNDLNARLKKLGNSEMDENSRMNDLNARLKKLGGRGKKGNTKKYKRKLGGRKKNTIKYKR
jgi:hypothetical protein